MKVNIESDKRVELLGNIPTGQCFEYKGNFYIRVSRNNLISLLHKYHVPAVNLHSEESCQIEQITRVHKVDAEIKVKW